MSVSELVCVWVWVCVCVSVLNECTRGEWLVYVVTTMRMQRACKHKLTSILLVVEILNIFSFKNAHYSEVGV